MRRGLLHFSAWTLATGAAVTLSWWGVHTVMSGTAYDPPLALPLPALDDDDDDDEEEREERPAAPERPSPERPSTPAQPRTPTAASSGDRPPAGQPSAPPTTSATERGKPATREPEDTGVSEQMGSSGSAPSAIKATSTEGGRVVFDMGSVSAELVSATPASGWSVEVFDKPEVKWIRVVFASGDKRITVNCGWHDQAPKVTVW
jgi:hypothetical protein